MKAKRTKSVTSVCSAATDAADKVNPSVQPADLVLMIETQMHQMRMIMSMAESSLKFNEKCLSIIKTANKGESLERLAPKAG